MRIKIFSTDLTASINASMILEKEVNDWLDKHKSVNVERVTQSDSLTGEWPKVVSHFVISIFYSGDKVYD